MNARIVLRACLGATGAMLLAAATTNVDAQDVVELRMRGRYFSEPATVRITVMVEPDARNRKLVIQADGEQLFRSSEMELAGEAGRRVHTFEFKNLPAGYYVVRAEVRTDRAALRGMAEEMLVVGDPGDY